MMTNTVGNALGAERADDHPELEGPEPAAELDAVIHIIDDLVAVLRGQVLGDQGERPAQDLRLPGEEHRAVHGREQPFVRVHHQRVGLVYPSEQVPHLGHRHGRAAVGAIDVEPEVLALGDGGDILNGIHRGHARGAGGGHHGKRLVAECAVAHDGALQHVGAHAEIAVTGDVHHVLEAEPERHHRLVDRRVRMLAAVDTQARQVRTPGHAALADAERGIALARGGERVERADGGGVGDHAEPAVAHAEELAQPVGDDLLEFGGHGRRAPEHAVEVQRGGDHLAEDAGHRRRVGEVGQEAWVVPVRRAGQDDAVEVGDDVVERLRRGRRRLGQLGANGARRGRREHIVLLDVAQVGGNPVGQVVRVSGELLWREVGGVGHISTFAMGRVGGNSRFTLYAVRFTPYATTTTFQRREP